MGCAIVGKTQRLRVVNNTDGFHQTGFTITLQFAGLPSRTLQPGQATTYARPFGDYLAPGQHWLQGTDSSGGLVIIWLK